MRRFLLQTLKRLFAAAALAVAGCGGGGDGATTQSGAVPPAPSASSSPASPAPRTSASPGPTPVVQPTPAATATPTEGNVARYDGCPVFTAGDYYNADISSAPVDSNSPSYIRSSIAAGNAGGFAASTGVYKVNDANDATPMVKVHQETQIHQFPNPYPWLPNFYIERLSDAHAMVVQTQTCRLYESYSTSYRDGVLWAYSGAIWDLTASFVPLPAGNPSSMASGLPLFAGIVKWEDYESGAIDHALDWDSVTGTVAPYSFVRPASDTDGLPFRGSSPYQIPYGAHLRLKSSFSTDGWGPQATMVANALKRFGMYLADTGADGNKLYFANAANGSNPWNSADLAALGRIHLSDFDVVALPPIQRTPGH